MPKARRITQAKRDREAKVRDKREAKAQRRENPPAPQPIPEGEAPEVLIDRPTVETTPQ